MAGAATPKLEHGLDPGKERQTTEEAPQIRVTAVVHLSLGVLWSWRLGKGTAQ
ncbi:MAG TPA: hypothetical protein VG099_10900 [Gemmataceae bacterium]|nr:hypothetical protein [Gemmataceae bacterium]